MNIYSRTFAPQGASLALALLLSACGGGEAEAPPSAAELAAPTVSITDSETGVTAAGDVTFIFSFSKNVGTSFGVDDAVVAGGSKGVFTMSTDGKSATLLVSPTPNSSGSMTVSVAAGAFTDSNGQANAAAASKSQAYSTVPKTQMALPLNFDSATVNYAFIGFGGAEDSTLAADPTNGANMAAKVVRAAGAETYAGTTLSAAAGLGITPKIPFNITDTRITVRVWSPDAGIAVRLKVEDHADATRSVETEAMTTTAAGWQTLTFDFKNHASGTAAMNLGYNYDKATIFFDFGRDKAAAVQKTYYFDDVTFVPGVAAGGGGGGGGGAATTLLSFDEAAPAFTGMGAYGGAVPTVEAGPTGGSGMALKIVKPTSPDTWGGTFFGVAAVPFTADRKVVTARVNSSKVGAIIKFKVEVAGGPSVEVAGTATGAANTWGTVSWDFAAVDLSKAYTIVAITPDSDVVTNGQIYFIDTISLAAAAPVVPPPAPGATFVSFDEGVPAFSAMGAYGGALPTVEVGPTGGTGNALKLLKPTGQETWGGVFFTTATIPFAAGSKAITARVYSTRAAAVIKFKVEVPGGTSVEVAAAATGAANTWSTVTWDFSAVDLSKTYKIIAITPDAETATSGQTYYFDDIKVAASAAGGSAGPITIASLDEPGATLVGFEGGWVTVIMAESAVALENAACGSSSANKVGKWIKPATNVANYAGFTVVTVANGGLPTIGFTDTAKTMTVRVWSPDAGIPVRLKVEDVGDGSKFVETETLTTTAGGWQTLTFNFAAPAAGALNLAYTYNKVSIFFNFGAVGSGKNYFFDDITFVTGTGTNTVLVTFDETTPRVLTGFGGAENSTVVGTSLQPGGASGPANVGAANTTRAAKVIKNAGEVWAGTTVVAKLNDAVPTIPFATGATKMSLRVCSPYPAGMRVRMKVEKAGTPSINSEVDAYTTTSNAWETLTFDFGPLGKHFIPNGPGPNGYNLSLPTSQLNVSQTYNKVNVFFDFGLGDGGYGTMPDARTYYFDELKFVGP